MLRQNKSAPRSVVRVIGCVVAIAGGATLLSGCQEYLDRSDTMTLGVGDAVEFNKAAQTIDRWPRNVGHDRWLSDGERARLAAETYRTRKIPDVTPTGTKSGSAPTVGQN